ncbi:MAG TPA: DUF58 domain-containing protein [Candidatus Limnocylindrales bacterium]|nr:DUF58 domain-containing protein [Candidatus Limnocylindrales bacterium]
MHKALKSFWAGLDGEAWLRFFLAIAGLALALAAAVFSSAARESGNIAATAIFASTALFLAGLVGVTSVPYLARRVAAGRMRDALHYEVTREGMVYLGIAMVIAIAALNTANNLLFIVLAAMLAAIVVSGIGSAAVLRRLDLDIVMPQNAFAGKAVAVRVRLGNPRLWFPAFSVKVFTPVDKKKKAPGWEWQKTEFIFPKRKQWFRLPDYTLRRKNPPPRQAKVLTRPVYFTFVGPRSTAEIEVELVFPRRGFYTQDSFSVATRFPFSFLLKSRRVQLDRELLVYPALLDSDDVLDVLPMITGEFVSYMRGRGSELYLIREYTPHDPARYLDWKATAKTGSLKVREFSREDERRLRLVFDNPVPGRITPVAYERAVSLAATLACHFNAENIDLSFAGSGFHGGSSLEEFLRYLALVHPSSSPDPVLDLLPVSSDFNVILTARKPGTLPSALWHSSYVIYM